MEHGLSMNPTMSIASDGNQVTVVGVTAANLQANINSIIQIV